jgi:hypothetical protein
MHQNQEKLQQYDYLAVHQEIVETNDEEALDLNLS